MISMIYVSTARHRMDTAELDGILAVSRRNNERDGITGMLLYADGNFIQVVEGDPADLDKLIERLNKDSRHQEIIVIGRYDIDARQFPDWSMGFRRVDGSKSAELAAAFANLKRPLFDEAAAGKSSIAHRLLEGFRARNIA